MIFLINCFVLFNPMPARYFLLNEEMKDLNRDYSLVSFLLDQPFRLEEKIWFCRGQIPLLEESISLLKEQAEAIHQNLPDALNKLTEHERVLARLINKNKAFHSGLICVSVLYIKSAPGLIITLIPSEANQFELKKQSLLLAFSDSIKYASNRFNRFRFFNIPFWETIQYAASRLKADGLIILNEKKEIVEYPEANLFFIKEKVLYTPSPETGCYLDPMRQKILEAAANMEFHTVETSRLTRKNILNMDEAFLAGQSRGMQKIMGIGMKRFTHPKTQMLHEQVNAMILQD